MPGLRLGVLVSGSGSNLQSVIDASEQGSIQSQVACIISNKEEAYGLERGRKHHIPSFFVNPKEAGYDEQVLALLAAHQVDVVVLAGYLKIVPQMMVEVYRGRMINIHPSLLPKYGGKGYYGIHVHEAVIAHGETESGATVHYVDGGIDTGAIIHQGKVAVNEEDTAASLQQRVLEEVEHRILVEAIKMLEEEGK
ncbi:MAG: phosphoribosylglycinamide formyltransferase [Cellulosilyticaceae bacterium]